MEEYERTQIESLLDRDAELRDLWKEHLQLEVRIAEIEAMPHLSPTESLTRKQLQKQKLAGKDKIAEIVARLSNG